MSIRKALLLAVAAVIGFFTLQALWRELAPVPAPAQLVEQTLEKANEVQNYHFTILAYAADQSTVLQKIAGQYIAPDKLYLESKSNNTSSATKIEGNVVYTRMHYGWEGRTFASPPIPVNYALQMITPTLTLDTDYTDQGSVNLHSNTIEGLGGFTNIKVRRLSYGSGSYRVDIDPYTKWIHRLEQPNKVIYITRYNELFASLPK